MVRHLDKAILLALLALFVVLLSRQTAEHQVVWKVRSMPSSEEDKSIPVDKTSRKARFQQGVLMLQRGHPDYAVTVFRALLKNDPHFAEAWVNLAYAYLDLGKPRLALTAFDRATDIRPQQTNAYWGMALAEERLQDLPAAIGAMRAYIHLSSKGDPRVRRARAALWEWGDILKNGRPSPEVQQAVDQKVQQWEQRNAD